jgi:hypothetical protein
VLERIFMAADPSAAIFISGKCPLADPEPNLKPTAT